MKKANTKIYVALLMLSYAMTLKALPCATENMAWRSSYLNTKATFVRHVNDHLRSATVPDTLKNQATDVVMLKFNVSKLSQRLFILTTKYVLGKITHEFFTNYAYQLLKNNAEVLKYYLEKEKNNIATSDSILRQKKIHSAFSLLPLFYELSSQFIREKTKDKEKSLSGPWGVNKSVVKRMGLKIDKDADIRKDRLQSLIIMQGYINSVYYAEAKMNWFWTLVYILNEQEMEPDDLHKVLNISKDLKSYIQIEPFLEVPLRRKVRLFIALYLYKCISSNKKFNLTRDAFIRDFINYNIESSSIDDNL